MTRTAERKRILIVIALGITQFAAYVIGNVSDAWLIDFLMACVLTINPCILAAMYGYAVGRREERSVKQEWAPIYFSDTETLEMHGNTIIYGHRTEP